MWRKEIRKIMWIWHKITTTNVNLLIIKRVCRDLNPDLWFVNRSPDLLLVMIYDDLNLNLHIYAGNIDLCCRSEKNKSQKRLSTTCVLNISGQIPPWHWSILWRLKTSCSTSYQHQTGRGSDAAAGLLHRVHMLSDVTHELISPPRVCLWSGRVLHVHTEPEGGVSDADASCFCLCMS